MDLKQLDIRDYLANCPPLTELEDGCLDEVIAGIDIVSLPAGTDVLSIGESNDKVYLIRDGAVEITKEDGELYGQFSDGEWFGYRSVIRGGQISLNVTTLETSLLYAVPGDLFMVIHGEFERVRKYFSEHKPERLRGAIEDMQESDEYSMVTLHVEELMKLPMLVNREDNIQQVAQQMDVCSAKSAMVTSNEGHLEGIVTDQDFRKRVIAAGRDYNLPIADIMTPNPLTLSPKDQASEALLLMARRNIRHIPVLDHSEIVGVISATDLLRSQSHHAIYLVGDVYAAADVSRLVELSKELPNVLVGLVRNSLPAYDIGHAITSVGQAISRRLLEQAEDKFGAPPVPYAFIVAGSMARREQTAHSDQDNGMILSDEYNEAEHGDYFRNVATYVSDGLDACGYIYCPGNIMATNDQWRQPLSVWRSYFHKWIDSPQPQALMNASIFFDLRCLHGDEDLLNDLQAEILEKTKKQTLFQAFMAGNALSHKPPLGFFRGFVLEKTKEKGVEKGMDMKKRGVVPFIDLARVYTLAGGLSPINTWDRLEALSEAKVFTGSVADDLRDAFEFITTVRLQHQAAQIENGQEPNNYVPPEELSALERRHLKDAFEVISTAQDSMSHRYQADRFR